MQPEHLRQRQRPVDASLVACAEARPTAGWSRADRERRRLDPVPRIGDHSGTLADRLVSPISSKLAVIHSASL